MQFSVLIATYNRCDCLRRTLPTVLAQDFPAHEYEVIVVVDGSTDGTLEFLDTVKPGGRFQVARQRHRGQAAAINYGLRLAGGERVLFLDDDILCPANLLAAHAEARLDAIHQLVFGPVLLSDDSPPGLGTDWARSFCDDFFARLTPERTQQGWFQCVGSANSSAPLHAVRDAGGLDERLWRGNDKDLGWKLWESGLRFSYQPAAKVRHIFQKTVADIVAEARDEGRGLVLLCRKHPELRGTSGLTSVLRKPFLSRAARHLAMRSPIPPGPFLHLGLRAAQTLRGMPWGRRLALRLLRAALTVEVLRGAVRECGSARAFKSEFLVRIPALMYHNVGAHWPGGDANLTISLRSFERHVGWLSRHGFRTISTAQLAAFYAEAKPLPEKPILLTFDDAYEDIPTQALPILEKHGFKATVFVVTSQIDGTNAWDEAAGWACKRLMRSEDIRAWSKRGFEFQSHSHTHADLTGLEEPELMRELTTSRAQLEALVRQPMTSFAYPYGYHNPLAKECVGRAFSLGLSCESGLSDLLSDPLLIPRVNMLPQYGWFSPWFEIRLGYNPLLRVRLWLGKRYRALARRAPACCTGMVAGFERLARRLKPTANDRLPSAANHVKTGAHETGTNAG